MKILETTFILLVFISTICFAGTISPAVDSTTTGEYAVPADADLSRVIWQAEQSGNPGFEDWNTMYQPDEITATITGENTDPA